MLETLHDGIFDAARGGPIRTHDEFLWRAAAHQLKLRVEVGWGTAAWEEQVVAAYLDSVEKLGKLAAGLDLDVALLLEPMAAARDRPTAEEVDLLKPPTFAYYQRQYQRLRAGLSALRQRNASARLSIHDADDAFRNEPGTVFADWMHANAMGERLMVGFMAEIVRRRLAHRLRDQADVPQALEHARAVIAVAPGHAEAAAPVPPLEAAIADAASRLDAALGASMAEQCHPAPFVQFSARPRGRHADGAAARRPLRDAWGFPNAAVPSVRKSEGEIRIFVLGDGDLLGSADLESTVPALLERALRGAGAPTARVYDFTVVSASARQMAALLFHKLVDHQPDLVMVCSGGGDFANAHRYDPRPGYPFNFFIIEELYANFFDPTHGNQIGTRDAFLARAAARQLRLKAEAAWNSATWQQRIAAAYLKSVEKLGALATSFDLDIAVVLEPMPATARGFPDPEAFDAARRHHQGLRAALVPTGRPSADPRLTLHDGDAALADAPAAAFSDGRHLNELGRRLMATYLATIARSRLAARRPPGG